MINFRKLSNNKYLLGMIVILFVAFSFQLGMNIQKNRIRLAKVELSRNKIYSGSSKAVAYNPPTPTPDLSPKPEVIENPAPGKIAYIKNGEIWTINADRTDSVNVTNDKYNKFGIAISPDGNRIAYSYYPEDPDERTNQGYYVGFNSGLSVIDLDTKEVHKLIEYGNIQNHYPAWSGDGQYLTVWTGNGMSSSLFDMQTHEKLLQLSTDTDNISPDRSISPFVWIPSQDKISYILNGEIIISNPDGSEAEVIVSGADALRHVHEGPNVPSPPQWSSTGRYVAYYKDADLYIYDSSDGTEALIGAGDEDSMFGKYPNMFSAGFTADGSSLIAYDSSENESRSFILDLNTMQEEEIGQFGQSMVISPNKRWVLGADNSAGERKTIVTNINTGAQTACEEDFRYSYYWWAGGFGYYPNLSVWSPDNNYIIGENSDYYNNSALQVLNPTTCEIYDLLRGNYQNPIWFPN